MLEWEGLVVILFRVGVGTQNGRSRGCIQITRNVWHLKFFAMIRLNGLLNMAYVFQVDRTALFGVIEIQGCHHLSLRFCVVRGVFPHAV